MSAAAPGPTQRRRRVREVDFRRPSKFTRDQIRQIERAHEGFCRSASSRLSAELRAEVTLGLSGSDQLPYSVAMLDQSPRDALVAVLEIEPHGTHVACVMEMALAHAFITRLLGGDETPPGREEGLTEMELAVAGCAVQSFVETLSATWSDLAEARFRVVALETSPMAVELVPPSEPTLVVSMAAGVGGLASTITLTLPHRSIASTLAHFERASFVPDDGDALPPGTMERAVGGVDVVVRAEVGAIDLPMSEVLALAPGDVVRLGRPAAAGAVLHVDEVAVYTAAPGRNGAARAVQVSGVVAGS